LGNDIGFGFELGRSLGFEESTAATDQRNCKRLIAFVNRKDWWHVPPRDRKAYSKRGTFLAASFTEAEFWGRPLDEPQRVRVETPLIGDETRIERVLFGENLSTEGMSMAQRFQLDAKMKTAALRRGFDSILLMAPKGFAQFMATGKLPRRMELNVLEGWRVMASFSQSGGKI
jgi:hypothetical protein